MSELLIATHLPADGRYMEAASRAGAAQSVIATFSLRVCHAVYPCVMNSRSRPAPVTCAALLPPNSRNYSRIKARNDRRPYGAVFCAMTRRKAAAIRGGPLLTQLPRLSSAVPPVGRGRPSWFPDSGGGGEWVRVRAPLYSAAPTDGQPQSTEGTPRGAGSGSGRPPASHVVRATTAPASWAAAEPLPPGPGAGSRRPPVAADTGALPHRTRLPGESRQVRR